MARFNTLEGRPPIVIAHRGASGLYPEHTLAGYEAAIEQGADFIEPDLVFTRDGHMIARHDPFLSTTTDVAARPEFVKKRRWSWKFFRRDWFVEDFTLAEIKMLRARQRWPGRPHGFDGRFEIPTFDEVLLLARTKARENGRPVGVYPEAKHPRHYARLGHDFAALLLAKLKAHRAGGPSMPVFIQSFDPWILKRLRPRTDLPLILLLTEHFRFRFRLKGIAKFADGVGPEKSLLAKGKRATGFMEAAHVAGLAVHLYTIRDDQVGAGFKSATEELAFYCKLGVDGVFADFPGTAVAARSRIFKR